MNLLKANARKVKALSPVGLWLFIIGRVLAALGLGMLAMAYFPRLASWAAWPLVVAGIVALVTAFGFFGRGNKTGGPPALPDATGTGRSPSTMARPSKK